MISYVVQTLPSQNTLCMGLRLLKEEVAEAFVPSPECSDTDIVSEASPAFQATQISELKVSSHRSKQADEIMQLSDQLIGSADAAVDVLNDFVCTLYDSAMTSVSKLNTLSLILEF